MCSPHQPVGAAYSRHHRPRVTPATDRRNQARGCPGDPRLLRHRHSSRGPWMAGPSPGLSGSGIWAAIQILPTTDGPLGRACPVGLQPTDLIRGRPRPHQNQLRRGEDVDARAKPAQRGLPGGCSTRIFQYSDVVSKSEPDSRGRHAVIRCLTIAREHAPPVTIATERIMPGRPTPYTDPQSEPLTASHLGLEARP